MPPFVLIDHVVQHFKMIPVEFDVSILAPAKITKQNKKKLDCNWQSEILGLLGDFYFIEFQSVIFIFDFIILTNVEDKIRLIKNSFQQILFYVCFGLLLYLFENINPLSYTF